MRNPIYNDEEIKQILHTLFVEKKTVKEIALPLQPSPQEEPLEKAPSAEAEGSENDIQTLKKMLGTFKKKLTEEQNYRNQQEQLEDENASLRIVQHDLKNQIHLLENEREKLHQQLSVQNLHFEAAQELLSRQKQQIEKLAGTINEQEKRIQNLQQFEYTVKKTQEHRRELEMLLEESRAAIKIHEKEKENLSKTLNENLQHSAQLERVIQHLRERSEEAHLEADQLSSEYQNARASIVSLSQELKKNRDTVEELEKKIIQEHSEKQELTSEVHCLHEQFEILKKQILQNRETIKNQDEALRTSHKKIDELQHENQELKDQIKKNHDSFDYFEQEVSLIKQALGRSLKEAKELETHYLQMMNEKASLIYKNKQMQKWIDAKTEELLILQGNLEQACNEGKETKKALNDLEASFDVSLQNLTEGLQNEIAALKGALDVASQKITNQKAVQEKYEKETQEILAAQELTISEYRQQIDGLLEEKQKIEEEAVLMRTSQEEKETRIKIAQQHLAKKVKESTQLAEQLEEQKRQFTELQASLATMQAKEERAQAIINQQRNDELHLREQLQNAMHTAETQAAESEKRYLDIQGKMHALEIRNQELLLVEQKFHQLQSLLSTFGNPSSAPIIKSQAMDSEPHPKQEKSFPIVDTQILKTVQEPAKNEVVFAEPKPIENVFPEPFPSLFDQVPSSFSSKRKDNLFD